MELRGGLHEDGEDDKAEADRSSYDGRLMLESETASWQAAEGTQAATAREHEGGDHSTDSSPVSGLHQDIELVTSSMNPPSGAMASRRSSHVNLKNTSSNRHRLILLSERKRVYEILSLEGDEFIEVFDNPDGNLKVGEDRLDLGRVPSRPELTLSDANQNENGCREGQKKATRSVHGRTKKRTCPDTILASSKRIKRKPDMATTKAGSCQSKVSGNKSDEQTPAAQPNADPCKKSVLIEVSQGEMVQVHGKERAMLAVVKRRAIVVQCFVCLEQYQVDRSAEALYCTRCESLTRFGRGLRKQARNLTPDERFQHDRRIAEQIRNHGGFEDAIHRTNRRHEQIREENMRIK